MQVSRQIQAQSDVKYYVNLDSKSLNSKLENKPNGGTVRLPEEVAKVAKKAEAPVVILALKDDGNLYETSQSTPLVTIQPGNKSPYPYFYSLFTFNKVPYFTSRTMLQK